MIYRIVALVVCFISAINAAMNKNRIIGGDSIKIEQAPYQVSVYDAVHQRHLCDGGIISPNYILTAAARCANLPRQAYRIRMGSSKRIEDGDFLNVIAVIKHENYFFDGKTPIHDIALMRVVPAIDSSKKTSKIIQLPEQDEKFTDRNALLTGHTVPGRPSDKLRKLTVKILSPETCHKDYSHFKGIQDGQICAEHPDRDRYFRNGDSGGPLVIGRKQVGIVSWSGPGVCAQPGRPGVYTEVTAYRHWIDEHMRA